MKDILVAECLNCGADVKDNFKFCTQCGQKTNLHRLSLHDVLHDAFHYFVHADKSFLQLLKALLLKTGTVAKEFVEGKRLKYFTPLNFFLLVATIYVIVVSTIASHSAAPDVLKEHPELNAIRDPAHREYVVQIFKRQGKAMYFMNKYSNVVTMIAIPLISLIYWLFYVRGKCNFTEHLVACMYMVGYTNLIYVIILVPLSFFVNVKTSNSSLYAYLIFMVFQITYCSIFYYRFINKAIIGSLFKAIGVSSFAIVFWFALSTFLIGIYIQNSFWGMVG